MAQDTLNLISTPDRKLDVPSLLFVSLFSFDSPFTRYMGFFGKWLGKVHRALKKFPKRWYCIAMLGLMVTFTSHNTVQHHITLHKPVRSSGRYVIYFIKEFKSLQIRIKCLFCYLYSMSAGRPTFRFLV